MQRSAISNGGDPFSVQRCSERYSRLNMMLSFPSKMPNDATRATSRPIERTRGLALDRKPQRAARARRATRYATASMSDC